MNRPIKPRPIRKTSIRKSVNTAIRPDKGNAFVNNDICERRHYGMITGVSFESSEKSKYPDIVCVNYSYYDSLEQTINESCMKFNDIYTVGKQKFIDFCRDFEVIEDGELKLDDLIDAMCIAEYYLVKGKSLRTPKASESKQYKKVNKEFTKVKTADIEDIPDMIPNYWIDEYDPENFYCKHYYGIITNVREKENEFSELEHTVTVNVFIEGEAKEFLFFTNGESNAKYQYLYDLCDGKVENVKEKIKGRLVEVALYEARTNKVYINEIYDAEFSSPEIEEQVTRFAEMQNTK